jgi:hypothetical protein
VIIIVQMKSALPMCVANQSWDRLDSDVIGRWKDTIPNDIITPWAGEAKRAITGQISEMENGHLSPGDRDTL